MNVDKGIVAPSGILSLDDLMSLDSPLLVFTVSIRVSPLLYICLHCFPVIYIQELNYIS